MYELNEFAIRKMGEWEADRARADDVVLLSKDAEVRLGLPSHARASSAATLLGINLSSLIIWLYRPTFRTHAHLLTLVDLGLLS